MKQFHCSIPWPRRARVVLFLMLAGSALVSACGGGSNGTPDAPPPAAQQYSIGGRLTNLATGGTVLLAKNDSEDLGVSASGAYTFSGTQQSSSSYAVRVKAQPAGQFCNIANNGGTVAAANVSNIDIVCARMLAGGAGALDGAGGTLATPAADVTAPPSASLVAQAVTVSTIAPPAGLPSGYTAIGAAIDISVDKPELLNAPLLLTLRYDPAAAASEDELEVLHYDTARHAYEPVTILYQDKTAHTFQVEARAFSPFLVVSSRLSLLPASYAVSNFTPASHGWNIKNFGSYYSPGGNCLGMAGYATWYFGNRSDALHAKYSSDGNPSVAQLVAARAMLAQSQYWALKSNTYLSRLGAPATARLMRTYLALSGQPLILLMGTNGAAQHAGVVYGYDANGFIFYDTNTPDQQQSISYDGANWGSYGGYNWFSFVALPSLGRTEDFNQLTTEAEGGFTASSLIHLSSPTQGQQVAGHSVELSGTLSGSLNSGASMVAYVKGVPQLISSGTGAFTATLPISAGANTIVLFAGVDIRQQSNWYKNAATLIFDVNGTAAATTLLATLTWDQDNTDVDLYVTEPSPSGRTAWFNGQVTPQKLTLDFDNVDGYGPEHVTLTTQGSNAGTALAGAYPIMVHYYSDHGSGQTATGMVTIVLNEGQPNQKLVSKAFTISRASESNASPGSSGPDWVQIGTADLVNGTITLSP